MKLLKRLFLLFLVLPNIVFADSIPFQDRSQIQIREFDSTRLENFKADETFNYKEEAPDLSWFEKLVKWIGEFLKEHDIEVDPTNLEINLKLIMWVAIVIVAAALIWFLLKSSGINLFRRQSREEDPSVSFLDFEGSKEQLNELWMKAEAENDHVLALKYLYISSLQLLHRAGLLQWRADKTNREYLQDLTGKKQFPYAQKLTFIFERVHYGDYEFSGEQYKLTKEIYHALQESMRGGKA